MFVTYNFSLQGRAHQTLDIPCQDTSIVTSITPSWHLAVVADGVGSCKKADVASNLAANAVVDLIKKQFPAAGASDEEFESVILASMHGAANAIEAYVERNDTENVREYQTTLCVALVSQSKLYYGNIGDSGVIALDPNGRYHLLGSQMSNEFGAVYAIPSSRTFQVGKASFPPAAALVATDGLYNFFAPPALRHQPFTVDVPIANLFTLFGFTTTSSKEVESKKNALIQFLKSSICQHLTDDLSVAAIINTNIPLTPTDIPWDTAALDPYKMKFNEVQIYPSEDTRRLLFHQFAKEKNAKLSNKKIFSMYKKYKNEKRNERK